jgi:hypothetical protein
LTPSPENTRAGNDVILNDLNYLGFPKRVDLYAPDCDLLHGCWLLVTGCRVQVAGCMVFCQLPFAQPSLSYVQLRLAKQLPTS